MSWSVRAWFRAIIKLSRTQRATKVYRGTKGGVLPDKFWVPNAHGVRGGIELGFMSTTTDREVAMHYAKSEKKSSVVFEMQMGMVDRGAPLKWCSQFPKEEEILFAPLTGLHDLTLEHIISKMQRLILTYSTSSARTFR